MMKKYLISLIVLLFICFGCTKKVNVSNKKIFIDTITTIVKQDTCDSAEVSRVALSYDLEYVQNNVYRQAITYADYFFYYYFVVNPITNTISDTLPDNFGEDTSKIVCSGNSISETSDTCGGFWCQEKELKFLNDSVIKVSGWSKIDFKICSTDERVPVFYAKYEKLYLLRDYKFIHIRCDTLEKFVNDSIDLHGIDMEVHLLDN